jgi:hypothetical protein
MTRLLTFVLLGALGFAGHSSARADLVTITLGGVTYGAAADTVTLTPRTFTVDLVPNVPLNTLLQSGVFTVGDSGIAQDFVGTLPRMATANG